MKQLLLATALIAVPVAGFTAFTMWHAPAAMASGTVAQPSLGDLTPMLTIITDVQTIAATGDFAKAETRITDFETAWDDAAATMRPLNTDAWGTVDQAADSALDALRSGTPDAGNVTTSLATLMAALTDPSQAGAPTAIGGATQIAGIDVTDAAGRALPCETMLKLVADGLAQTIIPAEMKTSATDFQTKALERCNADDDAHADEFSAQALAILAAK